MDYESRNGPKPDDDDVYTDADQDEDAREEDADREAAEREKADNSEEYSDCDDS